MKNVLVPVLGFAAASGTGKTTLLEQLIPMLRQRGLNVGLIKHSHHSFDIDHPGKDSFRLRAAGASPVMLISRKRRAIITEFAAQDEPRLDDQLKAFDQTGLDLILVEGFKSEPIPKIELHREALDRPLLYPEDPHVFAVAGDSPLALPDRLVRLDINQPRLIAEFVLNWSASRQ